MSDNEQKGRAAKLPIDRREGETKIEMASRVAVEGVGINAFVAMMFSQGSALVDSKDDGALAGMVKSLNETIAATRAGGTEQADTLLTSQAVTLNAIFLELARRASINMGEYPDAFERYMRLALKAQSQCRTTLESLAEIRNPRQVAFVKQANIAAGHQQVNNGEAVKQPFSEQARVEPKTVPIKLLEGKPHGNTLDARAPGKAGRGHPPLETVGTVHRPKNVGRKSRGQS